MRPTAFTLDRIKQCAGHTKGGLLTGLASVLALALTATTSLAAGVQGADVPVFQKPGGEANLVIPDLNMVKFFGLGGHDLLLVGFLVSLAGLAFGFTVVPC